MIISAHQPAYLPWIGFFHKILLSDCFVILDEVQFEKNSFINRNKIKTPQGGSWLTVPLKMKGHIDKDIRSIEINNEINWKKKHWNSINLNYKKSKFFKKYSCFFEDLYKKDWELLFPLLKKTLDFFLSELKIETKIVLQSELNVKSKKQELIIDICKSLNGSLFVFGALGKNYVEEDLFKEKEINIYFQEYKHPKYSQQWGDFIPYLSILDVMFNVENEYILDLINKDNINKEQLRQMFNENYFNNSSSSR